MEGKVKKSKDVKSVKESTATPEVDLRDILSEIKSITKRLDAMEAAATNKEEATEPAVDAATDNEAEASYLRPGEIKPVPEAIVMDTKYLDGTPLRVLTVDDQLWLYIPVTGTPGVWYPIDTHESKIFVDPATCESCAEYFEHLRLKPVVFGKAKKDDCTGSHECSGKCGHSCSGRPKAEQPNKSRKSVCEGWREISADDFQTLLSRIFNF